MPKRDEREFAVVVAMLAVLAAAACIALASVRVPSTIIDVAKHPASSPAGYTLSLALFFVPSLALAGWFLHRRDFTIERKAFLLPVGIGFLTGAGLDILFGDAFFVFRNTEATLGLFVPGYAAGKGFTARIPIEEFLFYGAGFTTILLIYVWANLYWLGAYCVDNLRERAKDVPAVVRAHWPSLLTTVAILLTGYAYRYLGPPRGGEGFPGYFTFLVVAGAAPSLLMFRAARAFINWRAFSFTVFILLFISLLWEVTLGVPYAWWGYRKEAMLGVFIEAWGHLPIEAVLVWIAACFGSVVTYEITRLVLHTERPKRELLFGVPSPKRMRESTAAPRQ